MLTVTGLRDKIGGVKRKNSNLLGSSLARFIPGRLCTIFDHNSRDFSITQGVWRAILI